MSVYEFPVRLDCVRIPAKLMLAEKSCYASLILDTGASRTAIDRRIFEEIAGDTAPMAHHKIFTAGGVVTVEEFRLDSLSVLGNDRPGFTIFRQDFPEGSRIQGLLGIDFLEDFRLTIDLREGWLSLEPTGGDHYPATSFPT